MTALGDFSSGDVLTAADMNAIGTWTGFTPTWTTSATAPSLGNGVLQGRYVEINELVVAQYDFRPGSTTTFGTGFWLFTFPVAASFSGMFNFMDLGVGRAYDANLGQIYNAHALGNNGATTTHRLSGDGLTSAIGATFPFTWTSGDELLWTVIYEAA